MRQARAQFEGDQREMHEERRVLLLRGLAKANERNSGSCSELPCPVPLSSRRGEENDLFERPFACCLQGRTRQV